MDQVSLFIIRAFKLGRRVHLSEECEYGDEPGLCDILRGGDAAIARYDRASGRGCIRMEMCPITISDPRDRTTIVMLAPLNGHELDAMRRAASHRRMIA